MDSFVLILAMADTNRVAPQLSYVSYVPWEDFELKNVADFHPNYYKFKINPEQKGYIDEKQNGNHLYLNLDLVNQMNQPAQRFNFQNYKKEIFNLTDVPIEDFEEVINLVPKPGGNANE
jgi:hypothetical protein